MQRQAPMRKVAGLYEEWDDESDALWAQLEGIKCPSHFFLSDPNTLEAWPKEHYDNIRCGYGSLDFIFPIVAQH